CLSRVESIVDQVTEVEQLDRPAEDRIELFAETLLKDLAAHRDGWTVLLSERRALPPRRRRTILDRERRILAIWAGLFHAGSAEGTLREIDGVVARGPLGMLQNPYFWLPPNGRLRPEQIADAYVDLMLPGARR